MRDHARAGPADPAAAAPGRARGWSGSWCCWAAGAGGLDAAVRVTRAGNGALLQAWGGRRAAVRPPRALRPAARSGWIA